MADRSSTSYGMDPAYEEYLKAMRLQAQQGVNVALNGPGGYPQVPGQRPDPNGYWRGQFPGQQPGGNSWFTGPQTLSIQDQINPFMNAFTSNVTNATRAEYDHLRQGALNSTRQQATLGGGFGGSRMAVLAGSRLGELDRGQASQIAGLNFQGYQNALSQGTAYAEQQRRLREQQLQEPLYRQQQAQQFYQGGMGPYGQTSQQTYASNPYMEWLSLGLGAYSAWQGGRNQQPYGANPYAYGPRF